MKEYKFKIGGKEYNVTVNPKEGKFFDVTVNGATYEVEAENAPAAAPATQARLSLSPPREMARRRAWEKLSASKKAVRAGGTVPQQLSS